MWDETQSKWLLSPFPLAPAELPKILRAPGVLLLAPASQLPTPTTDMQLALTDITPGPSTSAAPALATLSVQISKVNIQSDLHVRCRGQYLQTTVTSQEVDGQGAGGDEGRDLQTVTVGAACNAIRSARA